MKSEMIPYWFLLLMCTAFLAYYTFGPDPNGPKAFRGTLYYPVYYVGGGGGAALVTPEGTFRLLVEEGTCAASLFAPYTGSRVIVIGHRRKERRSYQWVFPGINVIKVKPDEDT